MRHCILRLDLAGNHGGNGPRDRHVDLQFVSESRHFTRCADAFGHMTQRRQGLFQRFPLTQRQTDLAVTRQITRTGQNQIAQTGQAHEGFAMSPQAFT